MKHYSLMRFPDCRFKCVTLSYDDGNKDDIRLVEIMNYYGLKGTFNVNSGMFGEGARMSAEETKKLYEENGQEVAVHGVEHLSLTEVDKAIAMNEIIEDRKNLERLFGKQVRGMAYANGSYDEEIMKIAQAAGIHYSRTTRSTHAFGLPENWLALHPTCHHTEPEFTDLAKSFYEAPLSAYLWSRTAKTFYLWGHSYEFPRDDNWSLIENFAKYIGKKDDIWYATNGELYDYVKAFDNLE
ncbi:MAG: polysaccharide deacetylase family protein, partial [Clostridia bacterium]|nr:polysaccharide deacetylase family protein [Clostridia bacterium]